MYADSKCSDNGTAYRCEKLYVVGDWIIGCAGDVSLINQYMVRLKSVGEPSKVVPLVHDSGTDDEGDAEFSGLALGPKGLYAIDSYFGCDLVLSPYHAVGSGRKAVLAAVETMKALGGVGSIDPVKAVEIACRVDTWSALPVQRITLDKMALEWL